MRGPTTADIVMELGPYRVTDVLGDGATGIVYRATAPNGQEVAIKVLRRELALSERERRRFLDEAERTRRVQHPALVAVVDAGVLPDGLPYIAMPYLHGATLADRLRRGPMRFDVALRLFEELADGVHTLHRAGLVHRDIKPENIFVSDGDAHAILLDLGIAREVDASPSTTTHAGMIRGTPAYMAPERFFGAPATPATDIYELAVVLYFTLVGTLPWQRFDDPTERMRPAPPSARGVVLPSRLSTTLMRALAVSPAERPASAHDFAAAVVEALSPESIRQIANQATSFVPSHAPPGAAAYAPTAVAPVAYTGSGIRAVANAPTQVAPSVPVSAEPPKRKSSGLLVAAMTGASLLASAVGAVVIFVGVRASPPSEVAQPQSAVAPIVAPTATSPAPVPAEPEPVRDKDDRKEPLASNPKSVRKPPVSPPPRAATPVNPVGAATTLGGSRSNVGDAVIPAPPVTTAPNDRLTNCEALRSYVCSAPLRVADPSECPLRQNQMQSVGSLSAEQRVALDRSCISRIDHYRLTRR